MVTGSFVPWLHFSFYCQRVTKLIYLISICALASMAIIVSLWSRFGEPRLRPLRAGVFIALGLSGVVPAAHAMIDDGLSLGLDAKIFWLLLMAVLYISKCSRIFLNYSFLIFYVVFLCFIY